MSNFDTLADLIEKKVGGNDKAGEVSQFLTTGFLPLNHALSGRYEDGGLPVGRIVEIFGPSSSGKTAIATEAMIAAQRMGGIAGFADHERSFSEKLGESRGLSLERGKWIYRKPRSFEDSITLFKKVTRTVRESKMIPDSAPIAWVMDSLASMIPQAILDQEEDRRSMRDKLELAMATSCYFPELALIAEETNTCLIVLNQVRMKPGVMYGDPTTTPGGEAPKFYASCRLQLGAKRLIDKKDKDVMIGSEITARTVKNKINRPFMKTQWQFMFRDDGTGFFDNVGALVDFLASKGIIEKSGAYLMFGGKKYHRDPLVEMLRGIPGSVEQLNKLVVSKGLTSDFDEEAERQAKEAELGAADELDAAADISEAD